MTTVITPSTDSSSGTALGVVLAILLVAGIGYMIYAFNGGTSTTIIERNNTTTVEHAIPVPVEAPKAPALPEAPSGN